MKEIPKKSKAAVVIEFGKPLQIRDYPIPDVEPNGILVKVEMAGICGSDVHQWHGKTTMKPPLPNIPGHETIGRIVKLGEGRTHDATGEPLKVGDRIIWAHVECGECYWCKIARQPTLCVKRIYYGLQGADKYPHLLGGFAEYEYVIPKAEVVKVPDELIEEEIIGVGCAFRTAVAAYERLGGIAVQDIVLIQGAGPIGLYSTLLAVEGGAKKVIVVGAPQKRLELAKRWGANHTINIDEVPDPLKRKDIILKLTNGRGPDVIVEASGVVEAFKEGLDIIRKGGRYLIIGQTTEITVQIQPSLIVSKGLDIIGSMGATIPHYYKALQFVKTKREKYPFGVIVTNKYSLEQATEALTGMESGKEIKPVIDNRNRAA